MSEGGDPFAAQDAARMAEPPLAGRTMIDLGRQVAEWRARAEQAEAECQRLNLQMEEDAKEYIRLEAERDEALTDIHDLQTTLRESRAERDRLRAALEEYGQHHNLCGKHFRRACECGLDAAMEDA